MTRPLCIYHGNCADGFFTADEAPGDFPAYLAGRPAQMAAGGIGGYGTAKFAGREHDRKARRMAERYAARKPNSQRPDAVGGAGHTVASRTEEGRAHEPRTGARSQRRQEGCFGAHSPDACGNRAKQGAPAERVEGPHYGGEVQMSALAATIEDFGADLALAGAGRHVPGEGALAGAAREVQAQMTGPGISR